MDRLAGFEFCYLTSTGRRTGRPHQIEIWYAAAPDRPTLYVLSGGGDRADWVRNLRADPAATVRVGDRSLPAVARILGEPGDEERLARRLVFERYSPGYDGDLTGWRERALPVALDVDLEPEPVPDVGTGAGPAGLTPR